MAKPEESSEDWRSQVGERADPGLLSVDLARAREPNRGREATNPAEIPARGWRDIAVRVFWALGADRVLATAGSVAGLLAGSPAALPEHWTAPLKNRLATSVRGFDGTGFDTLAHLTHREATRPCPSPPPLAPSPLR